jgi:RNA 3'-terminal phosphate cyclase (ATP)
MARTGAYSSVSLEGETFGNNALGYDAFAQTTVDVAKRMGIYCFPSLIVAGFGRESRGEVQIDVEPSEITGLKWTERGELRELGAVVTTCNISKDIGVRALGHLETLAKQANLPIEAEHIDVEGTGPGCHVTVWAKYEQGFGGAAGLGTRGIKVETLCQIAYAETMRWIESNACLDGYIADQILIPCVFATDSSTFTVSALSARLLTAVWVVKQFLPIHLTVSNVRESCRTILAHSI